MIIRKKEDYNMVNILNLSRKGEKMGEVKIWEEEVLIPTYEVGKPDKTQCF